MQLRVVGPVVVLVCCDTKATPVHGISSDHICAIHFKADDEDGSLVSIISVHLPCLNQGMQCYSLLELERITSESALLGPVVILGDFSAV